MRWPRFSVLLPLAAGFLTALAADGAESLAPFRDQIEQAYNARDNQAIEATVTALGKVGQTLGQKDAATYYTAFARLRQSALPGIGKERARHYLDQCIQELEPLVERRPDYAQARALYASCLGASANTYPLPATARGLASTREIAAALKLAPDNPWVVFQEAVSDFLKPAVFGGDKERALGKLRRAEQLFVASRPPGSRTPVFGESETWLYIGRVQLALGRKDEARQSLEKARQLAPASADVRDEIARL